ncbi:hypothetical protein ACWG8W_06415 [Citricoccus zhacaiensis]
MSTNETIEQTHPLGSGLIMRMIDSSFEPEEVTHLNLTPQSGNPDVVSTVVSPEELNDPNTVGCLLRTLIAVIDGEEDEVRFELQFKDDLELRDLSATAIREILLAAASTADDEFDVEQATQAP